MCAERSESQPMRCRKEDGSRRWIEASLLKGRNQTKPNQNAGTWSTARAACFRFVPWATMILSIGLDKSYTRRPSDSLRPALLHLALGIGGRLVHSFGTVRVCRPPRPPSRKTCAFFLLKRAPRAFRYFFPGTSPPVALLSL